MIRLAGFDWEAVGDAEAGALVDARLQFHWAVQVVAAVGETLAEHQPDDSHANMQWLDGITALAGRPIERRGLRSIALRLDERSLVHLDRERKPTDVLALEGRSLAEAMAWADACFDTDLRRPGYAMPSHPIGEGGRFRWGNVASVREMARWFGNASGLLEALALDGLRCWPHHFDLATLLVLGDATQTGESARTVGIGMSPGDAGNPEPYFYVTPWPAPNASHSLPALPAGEWHREGWFGAVLGRAAIVAAGDGDDQRARSQSFLTTAIAAGRTLAGG